MRNVEISLPELLEAIRRALRLEEVAKGSPAEKREIVDVLAAVGFPAIGSAIEANVRSVIVDAEDLLALHASLARHSRSARVES